MKLVYDYLKYMCSGKRQKTQSNLFSVFTLKFQKTINASHHNRYVEKPLISKIIIFNLCNYY